MKLIHRLSNTHSLHCENREHKQGVEINQAKEMIPKVKRVEIQNIQGMVAW